MFLIQNELENGSQDCSIGILIMRNIKNVSSDEKLNVVKHNLEITIRNKYEQAARKDLKAIHPMDVYVSYYRKFGYTYHVLPQLESIIKGKSIPVVSAPVEAMFMAELKNRLLTAGHDLEKIKAPLQLKQSIEKESYRSIKGKETTSVCGDTLLADQEGIISSILKGPDRRTRITDQTRHILLMVYAPSGIEEDLIDQHLNDMESYVRIFSPEAFTDLKQIYLPGNDVHY